MPFTDHCGALAYRSQHLITITSRASTRRRHNTESLIKTCPVAA